MGVRVEGLVDGRERLSAAQLTDPEFGWREAEHAIDAAVARFGPGAVRRAVLTRRIDRPPALDRAPQLDGQFGRGCSDAGVDPKRLA